MSEIVDSLGFWGILEIISGSGFFVRSAEPLGVDLVFPLLCLAPPTLSPAHLACQARHCWPNRRPLSATYSGAWSRSLALWVIATAGRELLWYLAAERPTVHIWAVNPWRREFSARHGRRQQEMGKTA